MDDLDREWLTDMLLHARATVSILGNLDAAQLDENETKLLAVSHAVLIVGEAANRVSSQGKAEFSEIPWSKIIGRRNRLVHGYRARSTPVLVETVHRHLPPLMAVLEAAHVEEDQ